MNPADVIKSYLVGLGFNIDAAGFNKFKKALDDIHSKVQEVTVGMAKDYAKAGFAVVSALTSITAGVVGLMEKVAKTDLEYQKFALHMYMSRDAAMQLKIAQDALGESLMDITWNPELNKRFIELIELQDKIKTPAGFESHMKTIRDVGFEFTKLKVEGVYAVRLIGDSLFKYLEEPIIHTRDGLRSIEQIFLQEMPIWADRIGKVLAYVVELGISVGRGIKDVITILKDFYNLFGPLGKAIIGATALSTAFILVWELSPFGRIMMLISGAIALLKDFYDYYDGKKKSELSPVWDAILNTIGLVTNGIGLACIAMEHFNNMMNGVKMNQTFMEEAKAFGKAMNEGPFKKPGYTGETRPLMEEYAKIAIPKEQQGEDSWKYNTGKRFGTYGTRVEDWEKWSAEALNDKVDLDVTETGEVIANASNMDAVIKYKIDQFKVKYKGNQQQINDALTNGEEHAQELQKSGKTTKPVQRRRTFFDPIVNPMLHLKEGYQEGVDSLNSLNFPGMLSPKEAGASMTPFGYGLSGVSYDRDMDKLRQNIAQIESGGEVAKGKDPYKALGPVTKSGDQAYGKYQVMLRNWSEWAQHAGLGKNAPNSPENQELVMDDRLRMYRARYDGNEQLVAAAYFMGQKTADKIRSGKTGLLNQRDINGTTGFDYAQRAAGPLLPGAGDTNITNHVNVTVPPGTSKADAVDIITKAMEKVAKTKYYTNSRMIRANQSLGA